MHIACAIFSTASLSAAHPNVEWKLDFLAFIIIYHGWMMNNVYMTKNDNQSLVYYFFYVGRRRRFTYLVFQNLGKHFAEKACWAT
jgi:hypothetical protein